MCNVHRLRKEDSKVEEISSSLDHVSSILLLLLVFFLFLPFFYDLVSDHHVSLGKVEIIT